MRRARHACAGGACGLLLLAALAVHPPTLATATSTTSLVTGVAGLAAEVVGLVANNKTGPTQPRLEPVKEFAYPSKLALDAIKKGVAVKCGAGVGLCPIGHCCSQTGFCELTRTACDGTCQLHYSGPGSPCSANLPTPLATVKWVGDGKLFGPEIAGSLPPVPPDGVCGEFVGACPSGQCCSQFGFCVTDASFFCHTAACVLAASPESRSCAAAWAERTPVTHKIKLTSTWGRAAPDGFERDVILVNGKFPSPTIRGTVRDRVQIEYVNLLNQPSSVHWHGMRQVATQIMDGPTFVTQRLVGGADGATNASTGPPAFLYDFVLREGGAYWYHSHASMQYADGLRGVLFVDDPAFSISAGSPASQKPTLLFLTDWYHSTSSHLAVQYLTDNPDGVEPVPDNALANGIGQHYCGDACDVAVLHAVLGEDDDAEAGALCSSPTDLVLVNGAAFAPFYVSLYTNGPPVRAFITALDGVPVAPVDTTGIPVFIDVGQRARVSLCRAGATGGLRDPTAQFPVFVVSEMADASFDYNAPFNSTVAVLDFSGEEGWLASALDVKGKVEEALEGERAPRTLPWKAGADRVAVEDMLAVSGFVPAPVVAALAAQADGVDGDSSKKAARATFAPSAKHAHDREELDPVRLAARESMRSGIAFRPRTNPGRPGVPQPAQAPLGPPNQPHPGFQAFPLTPPAPNKQLDFYIISNPNAQNQSYFYVNGISLQPGEYGPSLLERIYGNPEGLGYQNAVPAGNDTIPPPSSVGWNVLDNDLGTVVEMVFVNGDDGPHPIHTHGHWVFVMEVGYGTPDAPLRADPDSPLAAGAAGGAAKAQPTDAPLVARDTVTLPANGYLRLRWIVDSPGAWLVHCHILMHSYVGLGFIMRDGI